MCTCRVSVDNWCHKKVCKFHSLMHFEEICHIEVIKAKLFVRKYLKMSHKSVLGNFLWNFKDIDKKCLCGPQSLNNVLSSGLEISQRRLERMTAHKSKQVAGPLGDPFMLKKQTNGWKKIANVLADCSRNLFRRSSVLFKASS